MRILYIEGDTNTRRGVSSVLTARDFIVDSTGLGKEGMQASKRYDYSVILLELILPDIDGFMVLRRLRTSGVRTPVIITSGLSGADKVVQALGFGADDYVRKPFEKDELIARILAVVRRSQGFAEPVITTGRLSVNLSAPEVCVDGKPLHVTKKEFRILEILSLHQGRRVEKKVFLDHLYPIGVPDCSRVVPIFVSRLRKKIKTATGGDHYIETVREWGYRLRDPLVDGHA